MRALLVVWLAYAAPASAQGEPARPVTSSLESAVCFEVAVRTTQRTGDDELLIMDRKVVHTFAIKTSAATENRGRTLDVEIKKIAGSLDIRWLGRVTFDSSNKTTPKQSGPQVGLLPDLEAIGQSATALVGTRVAVDVDPQGRITSFRCDPRLPPSVGSSPTIAPLLALVSEESLRSAIASTILRCPVGELKQGGEWKIEQEVGGPNPLCSSSMTATCTRAEKDAIEFKFAGYVRKSNRPGANESGGTAAGAYDGLIQTMNVLEGSIIKGRVTASRMDPLVLTSRSDTKTTIEYSAKDGTLSKITTSVECSTGRSDPQTAAAPAMNGTK